MQAVFQDAVERAAIALRVSLTHTRKAPLRACFTSFPIQLTNLPPPLQPQPRLEKAKANCRVRGAFLMNDLFVAAVTVTAGELRIVVDILPSLLPPELHSR